MKNMDGVTKASTSPSKEEVKVATPALPTRRCARARKNPRKNAVTTAPVPGRVAKSPTTKGTVTMEATSMPTLTRARKTTSLVWNLRNGMGTFQGMARGGM